MAKKFAEEIPELDEVVINSGGGDVFAAISIAESIKKSSRDIVVKVQGLCASAATLLLFADKKVVAAENSLFMFHAPRVMLNADYTSAELETLKVSLDKLTDNLERTFAKKFKEPLLLEKELWLDAVEAKELGLVDEVEGSVDVVTDSSKGLLFSNKCVFHMQLGDNFVRHKELSRIRGLQTLKGNPAADAIVEAAIKNGDTVAQVKDYVEAVSKVSLKNYPEMKAASKILAVIKDQMNSGAQNVVGSSPPVDESERKIKMVADMANKLG